MKELSIKCEYLTDKKSIPIVMKTCLRKTDEAIWEPPTPFLREPPPFELIPLFFHNLPLCPNFKKEKPPIILGGRGNYVS